MLLHYIPIQKTNHWIIIVAYSDVFQLKNIEAMDVIEHIVQSFLFLIKVGIM